MKRVLTALLLLYAGAADAAGWKLSEDTDPLTDFKSIAISTDSVIPLADRPQDRALLVIGCGGN